MDELPNELGLDHLARLYADEPDNIRYRQARYLMDLSDRVFLIAPVHGVDQADYDALRMIAESLDSAAVADHVAGECDPPKSEPSAGEKMGLKRHHFMA